MTNDQPANPSPVTKERFEYIVYALGFPFAMPLPQELTEAANMLKSLWASKEAGDKRIARLTDDRDHWTEETRAACVAFEDKYHVETVSIESHESIINMLEAAEYKLAERNARIAELERAIESDAESRDHLAFRLRDERIAELERALREYLKRIAKVERALRDLIAIDDGDVPAIYGYEPLFNAARAALAAPLSTHEGK